MRIIRTEKQKDNLAKAFWDMGKVVFSILVISPLAKPEIVSIINVILGVIVGIILWIVGYILDGREVRP